MIRDFSLPVQRTRPSIALRLANRFRIRTSKKYTRNSSRIRTYKFIELKVLWNPHLRKKVGGGGFAH
jgi:hypothetical protein